MDVSPSHRLSKLPPYLFADIRRKMAEARERGIEVITLGIGDLDTPTPEAVVDELCARVRDATDPNRHRYGCDVPAAEFPAAARDFYRRRFGVDLAADQVQITLGSKDALVKLALAVMNPGDVGIAPVPGYPTYNIAHVFAGGVTYQVPLRRENGFLVDFDEIPHDVRRQAKMLWLNYPNNPTTATADLEFFARAVAFARAHDILLVHDAAYTENTYDGYVSPSILQVPGADEVAVELFSMSKAFSMTGWRAGFAAGNASAVGLLRTVKENIDNGQLRAIQFAAAEALGLAEQIVPPINAIYRRRRDLVVEALNDRGWSVEAPRATIYVWAPVPEKYHASSRAFATDLLEKTGVVVTPGLGYGQWGEGFFRISLTYPEAVRSEALGRIGQL